MPDILAINTNTSPDITALVERHLRPAIAPDIGLRTVTAPFGARYISSEASFAIAGHAALQSYADHAEGTSVVLVACFGDPGLFALREVCACPVIGLAEAAMLEAGASGARFSIVTGGVRWPPMLARLAHALGHADRIASIRPVTMTGIEIAANPERALDTLAAECRAAARADGAGSVILGGAGLAGIAARLAGRCDVPLIDSVLAGARQAERLARGAAPAYARNTPGGATPSEGLGAALAVRLRD